MACMLLERSKKSRTREKKKKDTTAKINERNKGNNVTK